MSRISFRVNSIELKDSTIRSLNENNIMRLNLTQRPNHKTEEYLLKNIHYLNNINHEFIVDDSANKVQRLTLTLRSVLKKTTLAGIFNLEQQPKKNQRKDVTVDRYIQGMKENNEGCIECEYVEPKHSLVGYCTIDLKEIKKGENNVLRVELLTRVNVQVVGFVNLEVYQWENQTKRNGPTNAYQMNEPILFVDSGCPQQNGNQAYVF